MPEKNNGPQTTKIPFLASFGEPTLTSSKSTLTSQYLRFRFFSVMAEVHFFRLPKQYCKHKQAAGQRHPTPWVAPKGVYPHVTHVTHAPPTLVLFGTGPPALASSVQASTWQPSRPTKALPVEACWLASNRVPIRTRWYGACATFASRRSTC